MKLSLRNLLLVAVALLLGLVLAQMLWQGHAERQRLAQLGRAPISDGVPDADLSEVVRSGTLPPAPPSTWLEARTRRYAGLLGGFRCDTLVLPLQVEGFGFDRPNRQIMAADLVLALQGDGRCVADPYLVDLALGEGLRRRAPEAVAALARSLGARTVVSAYAGHDQTRWMRITLQVDRLDPGDAAGGLQRVAALSITGFKYQDDHPPFLCFREHLPQLLQQAGLAQARRAAAAGTGLPAALPEWPPALAIPGSAGVARLLFLAMLAPAPESRAAERLFSKAWVALEPAADDAATVLLRARILYHLHERPYALALLGQRDDAGANSLRALLNGNLPDARAALAAAATPWERFCLGLEVHDLEQYYGRIGQDSRERVLRLFADSPWRPLLESRLDDRDHRAATDTQPLGAFVDTAFPAASAAVVPAAAEAAPDQAGAQLAGLRRLHRLLEQEPARFCCAAFRPVPSALDLLDLLDSRIEALLLKQSAFPIETYGEIDAARASLESHDAELAGNPQQEQLRAQVQHEELARGLVADRDGLTAQFQATAYAAVKWEQGQTWASRQALWYLEQPPEHAAVGPMRAFGSDYPPRQYWNEDETQLETVAAFSTDEADAVQSWTSLHPFRALLRARDLEQRFIGNPDTTQQWAGATPEDLRAAMAQDPDDWQLYAALADWHIGQGQYGEVPLAVLDYPGFAGATPADSTQLSVKAYDWCNRLFWLGAAQAARPLCQRAAGYRNGSNSGNSAANDLALIERRYAEAAAGYLDNARRYQQAYDYGEGLRLLFALDRAGEAWPQFGAAVARFDAPMIWYAAMVGHRRANLAEPELRQWLTQRAAEAPAGEHLAVIRDALREELTDRVPGAEFAPLLWRIDNHREFVVHADGRVYHVHPDAWPVKDVGPSGFGEKRHAALHQGDEVPGRFALAADGFARFRAGNYAGAARAFDRLASYYYIEDGDTSAVLPYFAYAETRSGEPLQLRRFIRHYGSGAFGVLLARAVFAAADGDHARSNQLLERAADRWPGVLYDQDLDSPYVFLDICGLLYESTRDPRYRTQALRVARRLNLVEPTAAYAYAALARFSYDPDERLRALATAQYLDPQSDWAARTPPELQAAARAWAQGHRPFGDKHEVTGVGVATGGVGVGR